MEGTEPATHGLHPGTNAFEGQRLPCQKQLDGPIPQKEPEVVGQALGLGPSGDGHYQWRPSRPAHEGGQNHGPGRFGNG